MPTDPYPTLHWYVIQNSTSKAYKIVSAVVGSAADNSFAAAKAVGGSKKVAGPFNSKTDAQVSLAAMQTVNASSGIAGTSPGIVGGIVGGIDGVVGAIPNPLTGINAIGDLFQRLTQANTWLRIAEGLLGLMLLAVGLAKLSGASGIIGKTMKAVA